MHREQFVEAELASLCGSPHLVLTRSGSQGFLCALLALNLDADDEVVLPVSICQTMVNAVILAGATPILADVDERSFVRGDTLFRCLGGRTRVVVAHHPFGRATDLGELRASLRARAPDVLFVEDCAQALGAKVGGAPVGVTGDLVILSFAAGKPLSVGFGGAVGTRDAALARRIRLACRVGARGFSDHEVLGLDSSLRAAELRLVAQRLGSFAASLELRRSKAQACAEVLEGVAPILDWPPSNGSSGNVFHRVVVDLPTHGDRARYRGLLERTLAVLDTDARACVEPTLPVPPFASLLLTSVYRRRRPDLLDPEGYGFSGWLARAHRHVYLRTHDGIDVGSLRRACAALRAAILERGA